MTAQEFEQRIKQLQEEVTRAYLAGYSEARDRAQHTIKFAIDESDRLRRALEEALAHVDEDGRTQILSLLHKGKSANPESFEQPYRQNRDK
jgi:flagellar biosynthesis/type III secretory pathway protein FliH